MPITYFLLFRALKFRAVRTTRKIIPDSRSRRSVTHLTQTPTSNLTCRSQIQIDASHTRHGRAYLHVYINYYYRAGSQEVISLTTRSTAPIPNGWINPADGISSYHLHVLCRGRTGRTEFLNPMSVSTGKYIDP